MSKLFKIGEGALVVRQNGYGFDKQCPVTGGWSVLFLSGLNRTETDNLTNLFK
jgi:hypothetical protein